MSREVGFARTESFCSPMFADGRASLVVDLGAACDLAAGWTFGAPVRARVVGPMRAVGSLASTLRPKMIGAYLEPGGLPALLHTPAHLFTDRVLDLEDIWGPAAARLAEDLADLEEAARLDLFESALVARAQRGRPGRDLDVAAVARRAWAEPHTMTVRRLADAAGVTRQHLARAFRDAIGVSPKRYCRLARFQAGLSYAGAGPDVPWATVAGELGYADQSHMIAEFRELSSLTPRGLAAQPWFHPFIMDARARRLAGPA